MKCEKCNNHEANYYYRETINGKTTEKHLCSDCAREEGLTSALDWRPDEMFRSFFEPFMPMRQSLWGDFFGGMPGLTRTMLAPLVMPRIEIGFMEPRRESAEAQAAPEAQESAEVDEDLKKRREVLALKQQLQEAVEKEDYENAIVLRDKLRELEK